MSFPPFTPTWPAGFRGQIGADAFTAEQVQAARAPLLAEIERLTAELAAARAALEVAKSADGMREPKNGTDWNVQWWNESARVMLPSGSRIDNVNSFRNGTLILTIKRAARGEKAQADTLRKP